jgi:hypothetical protein
VLARLAAALFGVAVRGVRRLESASSRTVTGSVPSQRTNERKIAASRRRMRPSADTTSSSLAAASSQPKLVA